MTRRPFIPGGGLPDSLRPLRRRVKLTSSFAGSRPRYKRLSAGRPIFEDEQGRRGGGGRARRFERIANVFDADPEEPEDLEGPEGPEEPEAGLVMQHQLAPETAAQLQKIGDQIATARKYGPWIAAGVGLAAGVVAAAVWWNASAPKPRQQRRRR